MDSKRVQLQRAKLARLEERIGHLMTQRADEEDRLADMIKAERTAPCAVCSKPVRTQREPDGGRPTCRKCFKKIKADLNEKEALAFLYDDEKVLEKTPTKDDWEKAEQRARPRNPRCSKCGDPGHRLATCPKLLKESY